MFKEIVLLLLVGLALSGCHSSDAIEKEVKKVSQPLSFTVKSLDGKDVNLSKYQSTKAGTEITCPGCQESISIPSLYELKRYAVQSEDLIPIPWEVCNTRHDALTALTMDSTNLDVSVKLPTPSFLVAEKVGGVICVRYDCKTWSLHVGEMPPLLRSLSSRFESDRILLDFSNQECVAPPTIACIFALYRSVTKVGGRFAVCNLNNNLLEFFRWANVVRLVEMPK